MVVQSDHLPLSTWLVAPTSTSARAASFRPQLEIDGRTTRVLANKLRRSNPGHLGDSVGYLSREELRPPRPALRIILDFIGRQHQRLVSEIGCCTGFLDTIAALGGLKAGGECSDALGGIRCLARTCRTPDQLGGRADCSNLPQPEHCGGSGYLFQLVLKYRRFAGIVPGDQVPLDAAVGALARRLGRLL